MDTWHTISKSCKETGKKHLFPPRASLAMKSALKLGIKAKPKNEKSTHPLKRLKYGIGMERATHEPFCSMFSRQAEKSRVKLSNTPQHPLQIYGHITSIQCKDKACYLSWSLLFYSLRGAGPIYPARQGKEKLDAILFQNPHLEYDFRSYSIVHNLGMLYITFK